MKVLHINNFGYPDYQNDMVFHGGRQVLGSNYVESSHAGYMYESAVGYKHTLYGRGFTLYCRLPTVQLDNADLQSKISDRYFDYILFGSVFRNIDFFDLVQKAYPKERIIFIDGEDHQGIRWDMVGKGHYFKREYTGVAHDMIHPIHFAIPKDLIYRGTKKVQHFASIDPRNRKTYRYDNEVDYYNDYGRSYFGITMKKAGWDCLRHYEILMNGCFPAFIGLDECPPLTMGYFPKSFIIDYYKKYGWEFSNEYWNYLDEMCTILDRYCTTEAIFNYILERVS